jgi:hypothetical protein
LPRREWRILQPQEVGRVARAFTDEQARTVFWTLVLTGVRREDCVVCALAADVP